MENPSGINKMPAANSDVGDPSLSQRLLEIEIGEKKCGGGQIQQERYAATEALSRREAPLARLFHWRTTASSSRIWFVLLVCCGISDFGEQGKREEPSTQIQKSSRGGLKSSISRQAGVEAPKRTLKDTRKQVARAVVFHLVSPGSSFLGLCVSNGLDGSP